MKKIAVANLKGGVGKSSTTLFLAEHWAVFKKLKVLVVDLDPQANSSYMLLSRDGVEHAEHAHKTLPHFLEDALNRPLEKPTDYLAMDYIVPRASDLIEISSVNGPGQVAILPSIPKLWFQQHDFERELYRRGADPTETLKGYLEILLEKLNGQFHCVLFDCPPGFGTSSRTALRMSDHIVSPTIVDYTSMRSLQDFVTLGLQGTLNLNNLENMHVVVSKYSGTNSQQQALGVLRGAYRVCEPAIPMRDQVQIVAERHATRMRTYSQKYGRPLMRPLKPHIKGMADALYGAIFANNESSEERSP